MPSTLYYGFAKPDIGSSNWGQALNDSFDDMDTTINTTDTAIAALTTTVTSHTATLALKANLAAPALTGNTTAVNLTVSGTLSMGAATKSELNQAGYLRNDRGSVSGAQAFDLNTAYHRLTTSGNITASVVGTNLPASGYTVGVLLDITMGGAHVITWPAAIKWSNGTAPAVGSTGRHLIALVTYDQGALILGSYNLAYA